MHAPAPAHAGTGGKARWCGRCTGQWPAVLLAGWLAVRSYVWGAGPLVPGQMHESGHQATGWRVRCGNRRCGAQVWLMAYGGRVLGFRVEGKKAVGLTG